MMNFLITLFLLDPATPVTSSAKDALSIVHMNCMNIWTQIGWYHRIQTRLQLTVPLSSTEAVKASFMILISLTTQQRNYTRTITHGLQWRTREKDIRYNALCEWVERDLVVLERIHTSQNPADHCTKNLPQILFHRHVDNIMGHVPPPHSPHFTSVGLPE
eukprot:scaffold1917_cov196-Alexandrium_tamarense.AAC.1